MEPQELRYFLKNQDFCAAEIIAEARVAGGPAVRELFPLSRGCHCHSKSPGAGRAPTETCLIQQHTCSEQGNVRFQERERQTFCLANWHDRVWDLYASGRKVPGVWGAASRAQVIRDGLRGSYWGGCYHFFLRLNK